MRALPPWVIGIMVVLTGLLLYVGWHDRHEAGYFPFIMGFVFGLFTLAAIGGLMAGEKEE
jgi:hypothetical protein